MKRTFAFSAMLMLLHAATYAQRSAGGYPLSMDTTYSSSLQQYVPQVVLTAPNINQLEAEDRVNEQKPLALFRIGATISTDINYITSGTTTTYDNGQKIWRLQIRVPGAQALGLYYDIFHLPQGARLYLYNANGSQILGAYTADNNTNDNKWANEKVQGEVINMELDMDAGVDPADVIMHIDKVVDFYKSVKYLNYYGTVSTPYKTTGTYFAYNSSSPCEVNAICPQGDSFPDQRKASVHIEYLSGRYAYAASGTMMNNTNLDCTPYLLTATHVEPTNDTANATFSRWIFYFNYEAPTCAYTGTQPITTQTMVGGLFRARANFDSSSTKLVGDFLLLQLKSTIPQSYGAYLAGWDMSGSTPSGTCIGFHHPSGDDKKLSTTTSVSPNGNFNGGMANSHWQLRWDVGGTEEGSSGSGLFDAKGRLIGDLSGGYTSSPSCTDTNSSGQELGNVAEYSKLSLNWSYTYISPSSPATRLKDWLDPGNTGVTTLDAVATPCDTTHSTAVNNQTALANGVNIFPNPTTGVTYVSVNMLTASPVTVAVYNVLGSKQWEQTYPAATLGKYTVDLSNEPAGVYIMSVSTNNATTTRKIILSK